MLDSRLTRAEAERLAYVVAEALESASPNGLVVGEDERAVIAEALRHG